MNVSSVLSAQSATANATSSSSSSGYDTLGQKDFLRLLTTQMSMQDPFDPVDNKEMVAQMAQFSSLAGINDVNSTLQSISQKLDTVMSAQASSAANPSATTTE